VSILVVADVHANLEAFQAVIKDAESQGRIDSIWSLGDIVGYGPDPCASIDLLRSYNHLSVVGNHDLAAIRAVGLENFNLLAAAAASWTATELREADKAWLRSLPEVLVEGDFSLVHGSLRDPVWEYLLSTVVARAHFEKQNTPYGLVGHSHIPFVLFEGAEGQSVLGRPGPIVNMAVPRFVINPGSVGQPRDSDPRAAYALLNTTLGCVEFHRVAYDIGRTQQKMRAAGLPSYLGERLAEGH